MSLVLQAPTQLQIKQFQSLARCGNEEVLMHDFETETITN